MVAKKLLLILLALSFILAATGCGGSGGKKEDSTAKTKKEEAKGPGAEEKDLAFFKDKTLTIVVSTSPGGGYDSYARLMAPYLQKNLPGSTVIIKNVPGAGQVIGTNEVYEAKPDGLTMGIINKGLMSGQMAKLEGIRFDFQKFTWLGNAAQEPRALIVGKQSAFKTIQEYLNYNKKIFMGSTGAGTSNHSDTLMLKAIFKLNNLEVVAGFPGSAELSLAMLRGDVAGHIGSYESVKGQIDSGEAIPLVIVGSERLKDLPNVPTLREIAPPEAKRLVGFQEAMAALSRPIAAPPGLTPSMTKVLRDALKKAFAEPELLAKAGTSKLPINFMDGEETTKAVLAAMDQPPEVVKLIQEIYK